MILNTVEQTLVCTYFEFLARCFVLNVPVIIYLRLFIAVKPNFIIPKDNLVMFDASNNKWNSSYSKQEMSS